MSKKLPTHTHLGTDVAKSSKKRSLQHMIDVGVLKPLEPDASKRLKLEQNAESYLREILDGRAAPPSRRRPARPRPEPRWQRKPMTALDRRRVIELAYGWVGNLGPLRRRPKDIALALGLRYCTVILFLRRYRRAEGQMPERQPPRPSSRQLKITPALAAHLLDNATLRAWRGWSMQRRVHQIELDWQVRISYQTLSIFYKRNGILKMKAPFSWRTPTTDEERAVERRNWVALLVQHEMAGREIIYMDETSVSVWDHNVRTWMYRAEPLPHTLPKERAPNITVLGAISTKRPGLEYTFSHSTNQEAVAQLMRKVLRRSEYRQEVVVVWDNHSSHWSRGVAELIAEAGATLLPLPVNSSDLNQVERVWALLKLRWKRALYRHEGSLHPDNARELLDTVLRQPQREVAVAHV